MTEGQPNSKCNYCNRLCNRHKINVGDFFIIKRRVWRSSPQIEGNHLHICIGGGNFGTAIIIAFTLIVVLVVGSMLLYTFAAAHRNLTLLVIDLAALTILTTVLVGIVGNFLGIVGNLLGIVRPSFGELLLLLSQGSGPTKDYSLRRQYLLDSALKLYSINKCRLDSYQELLKWINHNEHTSCDYCRLARDLSKLLCTYINWPIMRQIWHIIVWIWTEPPRLSWNVFSKTAIAPAESGCCKHKSSKGPPGLASQY